MSQSSEVGEMNQKPGERAIREWQPDPKTLEWLAKPFEKPCEGCRGRKSCEAHKLQGHCREYGVWEGQQAGYAKAMQERGKHE